MEQSFKSLPVKFFYQIDNTLCDIYLRLNNEKFVKIVSTGDAITNDILKNFESKNVTSFYVKRADFEQIGMQLLPHSAAPDEKGALPDNKELNGLLNSIGINQFTCSEVSKTYEKIICDTGVNENIPKLLKEMIYSKKRFIYDHSYRTGVISVELAKKFDWGVTSIKEKLTIAALMHDLKMPEEIASIADCNDLNNNVSSKVKKAHFQHGEIMALELKEEMSISTDIVNIVKNHHQYLNPNLAQLTLVFIVAHEFVIRLYNYQLNPVMTSLALKDVEEFFKDKDTKFIKYVEALVLILNSNAITVDQP